MNSTPPCPITMTISNPKGFYGMCGNVPEWCEDCYVDDYFGTQDTTLTDPLQKCSDSNKRVIRNGWFDRISSAYDSTTINAGLRLVWQP